MRDILERGWRFRRRGVLGAGLSAMLLTTSGCGELIGTHLYAAPITYGLKVGQTAPITPTKYIGEPVRSGGKTVHLQWYQVSTMQDNVPGMDPMLSHSLSWYQLHHKPVLVFFDVPIHETLGFQDVEWAEIVGQEFGKQLPVRYVDTWMDIPAAAKWNLNTATHHAFFIIDSHNVVRYAWVGLFDLGGIQTAARLFVQHHYKQLWELTPPANRLPWNRQPGVASA